MSVIPSAYRSAEELPMSYVSITQRVTLEIVVPWETLMTEEADPIKFYMGNRFLAVMCLFFSVGGVVYARMYFPDFSWLESIVGGTFFGVFCVMCAASSRLFE